MGTFRTGQTAWGVQKYKGLRLALVPLGQEEERSVCISGSTICI